MHTWRAGLTAPSEAIEHLDALPGGVVLEHAVGELTDEGELRRRVAAHEEVGRVLGELHVCRRPEGVAVLEQPKGGEVCDLGDRVTVPTQERLARPLLREDRIRLFGYAQWIRRVASNIWQDEARQDGVSDAHGRLGELLEGPGAQEDNLRRAEEGGEVGSVGAAEEEHEEVQREPKEPPEGLPTRGARTLG